MSEAECPEYCHSAIGMKPIRSTAPRPPDSPRYRAPNRSTGESWPDKPRWPLLDRTRRLALASVAVLFAGCAALPPANAPLQQVKAGEGYRINRIHQRGEVPTNDPQTLVLLAFSGGGTRAAALAYGVLEELRRSQVTVNGHTHAALDEVDLIVGVSGGSFTALAYALYGDRLFTEFETRFLHRDVQGELTARALSPARWTRLLTPGYGRSELAADYYDEILFGGATFGDLLRQNSPMVVVSGTELSSGGRFEFTQDHFDLICSDLSSMRLSLAAATSSAVPVVLSPVTLRNRGGQCDAKLPAWVDEVARTDPRNRPAGRALNRYREVAMWSDSARHPYVHLVDGGISDNLGLRGMLEAFEQVEASPRFREQTGFDQIRHIVVIAVNAKSSPETDWTRKAEPPGFVSQLFQSANVPIDHYSSESVELLRDTAHRWAQQRRLRVAELQLEGISRAAAEARLPALTFDTIDVSLEAVTDEDERRYFMSLPTSLSLPEVAVRRLRDLGARLLRESSATRALLKQIEAAGGMPVSAAKP